MRHKRFMAKALRQAGVATVLTVAMAGPLWAQNGFHETFADDPIAAGRWSMMPGEDVSRFTYDPGNGTLAAAYDSGLPTARLIRPLGKTLTENDSFRCTVKFTIRSEGFYASSDQAAEISFGFLNSLTTGPDRAGFSYDDPGAFDVVSFDYFPNIVSTGGPSLMTTIIHSDQGQGLFGAIDFVYRGETRLNGPGESDLPRDVPLTAEIVYCGPARRATLRVRTDSGPLIINTDGDPKGGLDGDQTTITTPITKTPSGFDANAFGLLLWFDSYTEESIVVANLVYDEIEVLAPAFGDFDHDADVDGDDLLIFENCAAGPAVGVAAECLACDADGDGDVDSTDFGGFQANFTGAR